jgi:hypothetical protein
MGTVKGRIHPQDAIHAFRLAGLPIYKKPRPKAGDPGRDGIDVNKVDGKNGVLAEYRYANGFPDDSTHNSNVTAMKEAAQKAGYSVEHSPGDPGILGLRKIRKEESDK